MAKSARSKAKIRNRNVLRETVFGPNEAARIQRLAEKQKVTSGSLDVLMDNKDSTEASKTSDANKTEEVEKVSMDGEDAVMDEGNSSKGTKSKYTKRRKNSKRGISTVIRNKKGRVLSRTSVKWVRQKLNKAF